MFAAELTFKRNPKSDAEKCVSALWSFFAALRNNGQILENYFCALNRKDYRGFVQLPESTSLDHCNDNKDVANSYEKLAEAGLKTPVLKIAGGALFNDLCRCQQPSNYILSAMLLGHNSPVKCGDCFCSVPLYWLPATYNGKYSDLLRWKLDYESCDTLSAHSKTGKRFSVREMSNVKSSLSQQGRALCQLIEQLTNTPVYYFLFHPNTHRSLAFEKKRPCPGCQQSWLLAEPVHWSVYYRCESCRLVSNMGLFMVRGGWG